jgi:DNA topoisomerase-1
MNELIVAEKPDAAKNIAFALADSKPIKKNMEGVPYYEISHKGKDIIVASAVGHLFTVAGKTKSWGYPQFDIEWVQTSQTDKKAGYTLKYVKTLRQLAKLCQEFTVATDFDIEGEVIGYNVIRFLCGRKDANRMKFSTLTKPDLIEAYENKQNTIDWGQAKAGLTRHELDWYYGINLSSALTSAIKKAGAFKVLSSGRVQGPALKMLCDREKEIIAFKPQPYWEIELQGMVENSKIEAWHTEDKIFNEKRADEIMVKTKGHKAIVESVTVEEFQQQPPFPFDLTSMQVECYRVHKISPKDCLAAAQELYIAGYISYPRTSSQKLPAKIGYKKILTGLADQNDYAKLAAKLLAKPILKPREGKKEDEAHPAIFPTGITPENINSRAERVYDLIVRRFLATFADNAVRETVKAIIDVNAEDFICKGTTTKVKGWHEFYGQYATFDEVVLPLMDKGDEIKQPKIEKLSKETQPPKRYTQASIIKELDKRNLGTKATRAQIIDNLYNRGYVNNKSMEVTELGLKTCDVLQKYSPSILDEQLTRQFEDELEKIRHKEMTPDQVTDDAKKVLTEILTDFKNKEKSIGEELKQAEFDSKDIAATIGKCPNCEKGTLKIRKGKFGKFVGCDGYPDCKTIFKIPQNALIKSSEKICEKCSHPEITIIMSGKAPQYKCINPACETKLTEKEQNAVANGEKAFPEEGMTCPACKIGKMVIRKSFYGTFLGCNQYPKCKTMMKIVNGKVDTNAITKSNAPEKPKVNPAIGKTASVSEAAAKVVNKKKPKKAVAPKKSKTKKAN